MHLGRLENLLWTRVLTTDDSINAVAFGASQALLLRPVETLGFLERWYASFRAQPRSHSDQVDLRERVIAVVALSYGYLRIGEHPAIVSPVEIVAKLRQILSEENHPFVRSKVILAIGVQAVQSFAMFAPVLRELISEVTLRDRSLLMITFRHAYLQQRRELKGGESTVRVGGVYYPIWFREGRPLTAIEWMLLEWLDRADPIAQQIAVQAFAAFQASDLERAEQIAAMRLRLGASFRPAVEPSSSEEKVRRLDAIGMAAAYLGAIGSVENRPLVAPLLAEVAEMTRWRKEPSKYIPVESNRDEAWWGAGADVARELLGLSPATKLFERWRSAPTSKPSGLVTSLHRAFLLYEYRAGILVGFFFLVLFLWLWSLSGGSDAPSY
jgi:hypothetical protein